MDALYFDSHGQLDCLSLTLCLFCLGYLALCPIHFEIICYYYLFSEYLMEVIPETPRDFDIYVFISKQCAYIFMVFNATKNPIKRVDLLLLQSSSLREQVTIN